MKKRCEWVDLNNEKMVQYHDKEWGRPVKDEQRLFELLCLEGAQAGLSWSTILEKRQNYKKIFHNFDIKKCAKLTDAYLEKALKDPGIVRHRLKVFSVRTNAIAALEMQETGGLREFFWNELSEGPKINTPKDLSKIPASTDLSKEYSKRLKKLGFKFVGPTIIYAFMQASGLVNDHTKNCYLCPSAKNKSGL